MARKPRDKLERHFCEYLCTIHARRLPLWAETIRDYGGVPRDLDGRNWRGKVATDSTEKSLLEGGIGYNQIPECSTY